MTELPLSLLLAIGTMVLVIGFAVWSRRATLKKLDAENSKKSSLAKDGPGPQPFR